MFLCLLANFEIFIHAVPTILCLHFKSYLTVCLYVFKTCFKFCIDGSSLIKYCTNLPPDTFPLGMSYPWYTLPIPGYPTTPGYILPPWVYPTPNTIPLERNWYPTLWKGQGTWNKRYPNPLPPPTE